MKPKKSSSDKKDAKEPTFRDSGQKLRRLIVDEGFNNKTFGDAVGVAQATVDKWVAGWSIPRTKYHPAIKKCLNIDSVFDIYNVEREKAEIEVDEGGALSILRDIIKDKDKQIEKLIRENETLKRDP